jgi:hypothetical protein
MLLGPEEDTTVQAGPRLVLDEDDDDGEFVPRYIPASGVDVLSSSSDDDEEEEEEESPVESEQAVNHAGIQGQTSFLEGGLSEEGGGMADVAGIMGIANQLSKRLSVVAAENVDRDKDEAAAAAPGSPSKSPPPSSDQPSLPGAVPDSEPSTASPEKGASSAVRRKESLRGQANWKKLRVAHKVGAALKQVNDDNKVFRVQNENDDNTDWALLHKQDISGKPKYILLPNANFRVGWDMYIGMLLLYVAAWVPYRVTFLGELDDILQITEHLVDISFGIDIILNFFTGYYIIGGEDDGHLVYDQKKIALKYMRSYFIIDLVATLPFDVMVGGGDSDSGVNRSAKLINLGKIMKLLRGLKLLRLRRLQKFIRDMEVSGALLFGV